MKTIFTILICTLPFVCFSQGLRKDITAIGKSSLITLDGGKIDCYGTVEISPEHVFYHEQDGKERMIKQKKLKSMSISGRTFINLPITGRKNRQHEVIAYNDKYILTAYWHNSSYLYLFDRNYHAVETRMLVWPGKSGQKSLLNKTIVKYFGDCRDLIDQMNQNIETKPTLISNISIYQCGQKSLVLR